MSIKVFLNLGEGNLSAGFDRINSRIEVNGKLLAQQQGSLPANPQLQDLFYLWQFYYAAYYDRYPCQKRGGESEIELDLTGVTGFSVTSFDRTREQLEAQMRQWLDCSSFSTIPSNLQPTVSQETIVIIESEDEWIYRLPWHCWSALDAYPRAEITFSLNTYHRQAVTCRRTKPRILAVFGDRTGIDTQTDREFIQELAADLVILNEPQSSELRSQLDDPQGWDILFFAGHGNDNPQGAIHLNPAEIVTFNDLSHAVKSAIGRGLKLAIFNCCSGLGLAANLATLNIPTAIVMREAIPNRVAQDFLQIFLRSFESGNSLLVAVADARSRLGWLEVDFPCATWLPVVFWNPAVELPTWQSFFNRSPACLNWWKLSAIVLAATSTIWGLRSHGYLEPLELATYDLEMNARLPEPPDDRILIVGVPQQTTLSDRQLVTTLQKLQQYRPKAIGLDIYRDRAVGEGYADLTNLLQQQQTIVSPCLMSGNLPTDPGIAAPTGLPTERIGFTNFSLDPDRVVRRQLIGAAPVDRGCATDRSLSLQLTLKYLGITTAAESERGNVKIGDRELPVLGHHFGGYRSSAAQDNLRGFQVMLNYRNSPQVAPQVSLEDITSDRVNSQAIAGKVVLIGYVEGDPHDTWRSLGKQAVLPGVTIHAQMTSNLLSQIVDNRPFISTWSDLGEFTWILFWGSIGAVNWFWLRGYRFWVAQVGTIIVVVVTCGVYLNARSVWLPLIPAAMVVLVTPIVAKGVNCALTCQSPN